jgi:hypothetical protein
MQWLRELLVGSSIGLALAAWGGRAWAWEPACFVTPDGTPPTVRAQVVELKNYKKCESDRDRAAGFYRGEHYNLCVAAFETIGGVKSAADLDAWQHIFLNRELFGSGLEWSRIAAGGLTPLTTADLKPYRKFFFCELAELADSSISLIDWASGYPSQRCEGRANCRNFGTLGPLNSNHFGDQAGLTYRKYHEKALEISRQCKQQGDLVAQKPKYPGAGARGVPHFSLISCYKIAYLYEGYALHYLQDRWSVGHMWNRWGVPRLDGFQKVSQAAAISVAAGIIHGAEAITGERDALGSGTVRARWGFSGAAERFIGVGDMHANELFADESLRQQREWLLGCTWASIAEVGGTGAEKPFRQRFPLDRCAGGGWVTNSSLAQALDLELGVTRATPEQLYVSANQYSVPLTILLNGMEQIHVDMTVLKKGFVPMASRMRAFATKFANGFEMAAGPPPFDGVKHGGALLNEATTFTSLPDVHLSFDLNKIADPGSPQRALIAAAAPEACQAWSQDALNSVVTRCRATHESVACRLCEGMLGKMLSVKEVAPSSCQELMGRPFDDSIGISVERDFCTAEDSRCRKKNDTCHGSPIPFITDRKSWETYVNYFNQAVEEFCRFEVDPKRKRGSCGPDGIDHTHKPAKRK